MHKIIKSKYDQTLTYKITISYSYANHSFYCEIKTIELVLDSGVWFDHNKEESIFSEPVDGKIDEVVEYAYKLIEDYDNGHHYSRYLESVGFEWE